jgi:hypothetical protein
MKVVLRPELFDDVCIKLHPFFVESVVSACLDRHLLILDFDAEATPAFVAWRDALPAHLRDALERVLKRAVTVMARQSVTCAVVAGAPSEPDRWAASPPVVCGGELLRLLNDPLRFLVEHAVHDGAFLRTVGTGVDGDNFRLAFDNKQVVFEHGGGSDMRAILVERSRDRAWAHRAWVMFDSDALVPETRSREADLKIEACERAGVAFHVLERRSIENYIPHSELDDYLRGAQPSIRLAVGAFGRLSSRQRSHYNMKSGFAGDAARFGSGDAAQKRASEALFDDLKKDDRLALERGFGDNVAACFVESLEKGRPRIPEALRIRDGQHLEFEPVFRRIVSSL